MQYHNKKAANILCTEKDEVIANYEIIRDTVFDTAALAERFEKAKTRLKAVSMEIT